MSKSIKVLLGIGTIWPLIYMVFFFVFIISSLSSMPLNGPPDVRAFEDTFSAIILLHLLTMLLVFGLTIFYMVNVFRNDRVIKEKKTLWAVVLFLGNVLVMPFYWYHYIWSEEKGTPMVSEDWKAINPAWTSGWVNDTASTKREREYVPPPEPPDWR